MAQIAVPTVLINSKSEDINNVFHFVETDDRLGGKLAVEHLIKLGHTAIGYIGASKRYRSNQQRLEGYKLAFAEADLPQLSEWIAFSNADDVAIGQQMLPPLLKAGVTAIFCYNDMVAVGALLTCQQLGIAVPQDLSLVGFDGIALARYITPPLTTIRQPMLEIGCHAAQMLLDLLQEKTVENIVLAPTLVERGSTITIEK